MASTFYSGKHVRELRFGGRERQYVLYIPSCAPTESGFPVVVLFHGGGGTAEQMVESTGWAAKAEDAGCVVVAPDGVRQDLSRPASFVRNPQFWNIDAPFTDELRRSVDDVGFAAAALDDAARLLPLDERRLYACGFSNGAGMAFRVGVELSERFAAIAPVAGHLWQRQPPSEPVSMIYIAGALDPISPLNGGWARSPWRDDVDWPPISESVERWAGWMGCAPPSASELCDSTVTLRRYERGQRGAAIEFYTIGTMGHAWPGGPAMLPERIAGPSKSPLNATTVIWDFFQREASGAR